MIRLLEGTPTKRILFRLLPESGGVNYHELLMRAMPDGSPRVVDIYVFATGERLSETARRVLIQSQAADSPSLLDRLTRRESAAAKSFKSTLAVLEAIRNGQPQEALRVCNELPPEVQRQKFVLLLRYQAACQVSDAELDQAVEAFRQEFPDDPAQDLLSIDYFINHQRYTDANRAIARVKKRTGGDAYLEMLSANVALFEKKPDCAREFAERRDRGRARPGSGVLDGRHSDARAKGLRRHATFANRPGNQAFDSAGGPKKQRRICPIRRIPRIRPVDGIARTDRA